MQTTRRGLALIPIVLALVACVTTTAPVTVSPPKPADPLEQGVAAYKKGDFEGAYRLWLPLAERGDSAAQHNVGLLYKQGQGIEQDDAKAFQWFLKAALQGRVASMAEAGSCYREGRGVGRDYGQALKWLQAAADQGDLGACYDIGMLYFDGDGVAQDHKAALGWFRRAADGANSDGQVMLGYMYGNGLGVDVDLKKAAELYKLSASQDNSTGEYNLAVMYQNGRGVDRNPAEAARLYRKSAGHGDEDAAAALQKMADEGLAAAQYELSSLVPDERRGVGLLELSAKQGYTQALLDLGSRYVEGTRGVGADVTRGVPMLQKAAEQGSYAAAVVLGRLYTAGRGTVSKDLVQAYMWYKVILVGVSVRAETPSPIEALLAGGPNAETAARAVAELKKSMTGDQIAEASRKAFEWVAAHWPDSLLR